MFTHFVNLSQANSDKEVLKYVKKWGPLLKSGELVSDYVARARAAGAILNISENLETGAVGNPEDWEVLDQQEWLSWYLPLDVKAGRRSTVKPQSTPKPKGAGGSFVPWPPALRRQQQRILIASYINAWLIVGEVRPALLWKSQQPTLNLAIAGPFGALGLRLLETAAQNVITACSGCRTFFDTSTRERRPKAGQGRYCDECIAAKVPERLAKRRQVLGISKPQKKKGKAARKKRADSAPKR
ncbi:MAG: hypothetical protein H0W99_14725 [Acidobacteria bacterium]|nr:hypothetical protein [Acidobacteriota bacterium]